MKATKIDPITIIIGDRAFTPMRFQSPMPQPPPAMTDSIPETDEEGKKKGSSGEKKKGLGKITSIIASKFSKSQEEQGDQRKMKHFPQLANERLVGIDYRCELVTMNGDIHGFLQFTSNHLLFIPENGTDIGIPFCEVLSIQRLIQAEAANGAPSQFIGVDKPDIKFQAFEVFLSSGQLLIFKNFVPKQNAAADSQICYEAFNVLDHMWHACAIIPAPEYKFIPITDYQQPTIQYANAPKVTVITTKQAIIQQEEKQEDLQQQEQNVKDTQNKVDRHPEQPKEAQADKDKEQNNQDKKDTSKDLNQNKPQADQEAKHTGQ